MEYGKHQRFTVYGNVSTASQSTILILDMSLRVDTPTSAVSAVQTLDNVCYYDGDYQNVYKVKLSRDMNAHNVDILRHLHTYCTLPDESVKVEVRLILQAKCEEDLLKKEVVGEIIHRFCKTVFDEDTLPFSASSTEDAFENFMKGEW